MPCDPSTSKLSRRKMIQLGGMALAGVWGQKQIPAETAAGRGARTIYLPPPDSLDPVVHSRAENLFWSEIMMEHADLYTMHMPGSDVASQRSQAETFRRGFQMQFDRAKSSVDRGNYAAFSRSTTELIKPFAEYTGRLLDAQNAGKIRTFVFPLLFESAIRQARWATTRLERLATGNVGLSYAEVLDFWSGIMSDHSEFIGHLLDPREQDLISQALDASAVFQGFKRGNIARPVPGNEILVAAQELLDYEMTVAEGVEAGTIRSIIHPILADHMLRSAKKFVDELRRTVSKT